MITDLINHERITTTHAKAKALSEYAEGVINLAKQVRQGAAQAVVYSRQQTLAAGGRCL